MATKALLTITKSLWWNFLTLTKIWNGDNKWTSPNICINSDGHEKSIKINCCSYEMVMVTIHHYNNYSWKALNFTTTPILLATPPLVRFIFWWRRLKFITIAHMKWWQSLSIIINHYWWWTLNVTTTSILLVTFNFWWRRFFWPSPMSLWWHSSTLSNVIFSVSDPTTIWSCSCWHCTFKIPIFKYGIRSEMVRKPPPFMI